MKKYFIGLFVVCVLAGLVWWISGEKQSVVEPKDTINTEITDTPVIVNADTIHKDTLVVDTLNKDTISLK